ncbi:MAG: penicillin-binding protein, partial [Rhodospirillaceae bacterium]|nr:penicillin-binding protein [Rhodospirillaceae bacterium]
DTWFVGFSPDLAVGVFVGFDEPRSLGRRETGSSVPAPIFKDFMRQALEGQSVVPFRVPSGIALMRVNPESGFAALPGERASILEAFKPGTVPPTAEAGRLLPTIGGNVPSEADTSASRPRRGIY